MYTLFTAVHGETNRNFCSYLYILFFTTGRQQPIAGVQRGWRVIARDYLGEAASENRNSAQKYSLPYHLRSKHEGADYL